jgi:hypothetical protein
VTLITLASKPVEGTITKPIPEKSTTSTASSKTLTTQYYSTEYSARYTTLTKPDNSASLDAQILTAREKGKSGTSSSLALTVVNLPAGGVTEDSSYHLFKSQPNVYKLEEETINGEPVHVGIRTDQGYEKTYLWPHGKYLLTVVLTTFAPSPDTDSELLAMLQHVKWTAKP